jgi:hypothetical protein
MEPITIIKRQADGSILCTIDGMETVVPDDMDNRYRFRIWDEWEMGPPDPVTGERVRINTLPEYVAPPAPPYVLSIETFWERMTEDEAADFDDAIAASTARMRRMFNAASSLTEGTELFLFVLEKLTTLFGEPRALEIIAQDMSRPAGDEEAAL